MSRSINNIANNDVLNEPIIVSSNNNNSDTGYLIKYDNNTKLGGFIKKSNDDYYIIDDQTDENNLNYNSLGNLRVKSITADTINSISVNSIDSIAIKDASILLASGNTNNLNNISIFFQHLNNKYSGIVKEKSSDVFKLLDLTSLPSSLNQSFSASQYASLHLKDLSSYGNLYLYNNNNISNLIKTNSNQNVNLTYSLPVNPPSNNNVLSTDASGNLSWSSQVTTNQNDITSINNRLNNTKLYFGSGYANNTQASNSIVLNANSTQLNPNSSGLYVNALRNVPYYDSICSYNPDTKEISYNTSYPIVINATHGSKYSTYELALNDIYKHVFLAPNIKTLFSENVNGLYQYLTIPINGRYRISYHVKAICTNTQPTTVGEIGCDIVYSAGNFTNINSLNTMHPSLDAFSYLYTPYLSNVSLSNEFIKDFKTDTKIYLRIYKSTTALSYSNLQYSVNIERIGPFLNQYSNVSWSIVDLDNFPVNTNGQLSNVYYADSLTWNPSHTFNLRPTYKLKITFSQPVPLKRLFYRGANDGAHDASKIEVYLGEKSNTSNTDNLLSTYTPADDPIYANITRTFDVNYIETSQIYTVFFYKTTDYQIYLDYLNFEHI